MMFDFLFELNSPLPANIKLLMTIFMFAATLTFGFLHKGAKLLIGCLIGLIVVTAYFYTHMTSTM